MALFFLTGPFDAALLPRFRLGFALVGSAFKTGSGRHCILRCYGRNLVAWEAAVKGLHDGRRRTPAMIRKLASGKYRLYSRKADPKTHKRRNLGTFRSRAAAEKHEHAVQYFKRH